MRLCVKIDSVNVLSYKPGYDQRARYLGHQQNQIESAQVARSERLESALCARSFLGPLSDRA